MPKLFSPSVPRLSSSQGHRPSASSASTAATSISASYGTAASREAYQRIRGRVVCRTAADLPAPQHTATVTEFVVAYTEFATGYYRKDGKPTNEVRMIKTAIKIARELYGRHAGCRVRPAGTASRAARR